MSVKSLEESPGWSVLWKRVGSWAQAVKAVLSVLVGLELATKVVIRLVARILEIVFAVAARLPDVEGDIGNWLARGEISDDTVHVGYNTLVLVLDDGLAELSPWGVG